MDNQTADIAALLLKQYLFQGLDVEEITLIAANFRPVQKSAGQTVYDQKTRPRHFYIVYKGQVQVSVIERNLVEILNKFYYKLSKQLSKPADNIVDLYTYGPGTVFGEEGLFSRFRKREPEIVRTTKPSVLLRMERTDFYNLLKQYPLIAYKLKAIAKSRRLGRSRRFQWFSEGESIQLFKRKHWFFLARALILPFLLFFISTLVLLVSSGGETAPNTFSILWVFTLLGIFLGIAWGVWNFMDWGNDYYIVTTQRVVWMEKIIALFSSRNEAPLHTVLAVDSKSSYIGRIFDYGDVSARTYTGRIPMEMVGKPTELAAFIEGNKKRVLQLSKESEADQIREDIKKALKAQELPTEPDLQSLVVKSGVPAKEKKVEKISFRDRMRNFLKVRYEKDGVITYRKHWFILFRRVWIPLLFLFILFAFLVITSNGGVSDSGDPLIPGAIRAWIGVIGIIILVLWLAYDYVDWINDIYQLTPEFILDIERKPLGFEQKRSASIENILSIEHKRENISGILLNYGTVTVYVGETEFVFRGVFNPNQVHQDISNNQEALLRKKKQAEAERDRKNMINWLMTYHEETENPYPE